MKRELTPKLLRVGILLGSLLFSLPAISGYFSIQTSADAQSATSVTTAQSTTANRQSDDRDFDISGSGSFRDFFSITRPITDRNEPYCFE